jgi:hypothetical protein
MRSTNKSSFLAVALLAVVAATQPAVAEPLNAESLKQFGLTGVAKSAPYQMLTITVANFQVELCGIPATDTEPVRLVRCK